MNKKQLILYLLCAGTQASEHYPDPFLAPQTPPCLVSALSPQQWQLKGTIGHAASRHAWVITPQGQWLMLSSKQLVLDQHWQVTQITADQLEFTPQYNDSACTSHHARIMLQLGNIQARGQQ
ncbi:DUF2531 family protein [Serratia microhaemolytica]|uniref:DUF2531 family protein n=1 Tax=Serratia microhaemolytica TaxID=2675110 RepID=UPI001F0CAB3B|nr:DUF2531 family protein [Serratia microhaemolytica]